MKLIRLIIPLFLAVYLKAQEGVIDPRSYGNGSGYIVKSWTTENGLAQNSVLAFLQSSDNRVWISTIDHVASFDGYHFNSIKIEHAGTPLPRIVRIYESHSKELWFISDDGRLYTLINQTLIPFKIDKKINVFKDTRSGDRFFGTRDGKVYHAHDSSLTILTSFAKDRVIDLLPAKEGIYILTGTGIYLFKEGHQQKLLDGTDLICIRTNKAGDIYVAGSKQVYRKVPGSEAFNAMSIPHPGTITDISVSDKSHLVVGTDHGILLGEKDGFTPLHSVHGLSSDNVSTLYESKDGTIWAGTDDHGINLLIPKLVSLLETGKLPGSPSIGPVLQLKNKDLLVSYYCEGVMAKASKGSHVFFPKDTGCVWTMTEALSGGVWIGTYNQGLFYQTGKVRRRYFDTTEGKNNIYFSSLTDRSGVTWLGNMNGIFVASQGKLSRFKADISHSAVAQFCEDADGRIWACRHKHLGLIENGTYTVLNVPDLPKDDFVLYLYCDKDGVIWGITYNGNLIRYKDDRFFCFHTAGILIKGKGCNLAEDDYGRLWFGSFAGLYVADKKSLDDFADGRTRFINLTHIGKEAGMKNLECNTGFQPSVCKAADKLIYFSTIGGTAVLDPARYNSEDPGYVLAFGSFQANGVNYDLDQSISLKGHDPKRIECQVSAICFFQKENLRIQYRLDGSDSTWSPPTNDLKIVYDHIPPGSYKLRARVYGSINEIRLRFDVPLPFWRSFWFRTGLFVTALGLLFWFVYSRLKKRREKERLKNEVNKQYAELELKSLKAQMNPHFIFNCLNSIRYFIETDTQVANDYLHKFSLLIRSFLEQSTANDTSIEKEVNLLTLYMEMEALRSDHGFEFRISISGNIDPAYHKIPAMLIQPFVENAIHHGIRHMHKRGFIRLSFDLSDDSIVVTIDDNGIGRKRSAEINRASSKSHESMGSKFTEDRIRVINTVRNTNIRLLYEDKPVLTDGSSGLRVILIIPV